MRRRLLAVLAVLALTIPTAAPISAASFEDDLNGVCAFGTVHIKVEDNSRILTFPHRADQSSFSLTNGSIKVTLTNPDPNNPRSIDLNISGPGRFTADGSHLSTQGPWLIFLPIDKVPTLISGAPSRLFLVNGRSEWPLGSNGFPTEFRLLSGHATDLCPRLA
jgi:hypothetical protein